MIYLDSPQDFSASTKNLNWFFGWHKKWPLEINNTPYTKKRSKQQTREYDSYKWTTFDQSSHTKFLNLGSTFSYRPQAAPTNFVWLEVSGPTFKISDTVYGIITYNILKDHIGYTWYPRTNLSSSALVHWWCSNWSNVIREVVCSITKLPPSEITLKMSKC